MEEAGWMSRACQELYKDFLLINREVRDGIAISTGSLLSAFVASSVTGLALHPALGAALSPLNATSRLSIKGAIALDKPGLSLRSRTGIKNFKIFGLGIKFF